jgi:hypothetical protein
MPDKKPPYNTSGPKTSTKESKEEKDAMNAMMKARLAYEYMHGNPAAKRMVAPTDNPYKFDNGYIGTHYMSSYDNYAIPEIQDVDGTLKMTGPRANEAIRFDREEDARYFAKNYKRISPALRNGGKLSLEEAFEIHNQGRGAGRISLEEFARLVPKSDWGMTYLEMAEKYGWEGSNKLKKAEAEGKIKSLKNGGSMAPIIPTYYKSKGTPIYRDTTALPFKTGGSISIKPENKGKFTAKANTAGMGVQAFADKVLGASEGTYSPSTRRQANFARNASKWNRSGGFMYDNGGDLLAAGRMRHWLENNPDAIQGDDFGKVTNISETTVYRSPEKKKLQGNLFQKLDQLKRATKKYYSDRGFGKIFLKQNPSSDISGLRQNINAYKENLEKEKGRYAKAEIALKDLKKHYPDTWKDKKLADVFSPEGYQSLLSLQKNDKISTDRFRTYYDNFANEYDPYMARGKGPNKVYDGIKLEKMWGKDYPDFINMVNKFAMAAPLMGGMGAFAPEIAGGISSIGRGLGHAYTSLGQPIIGSTTSTGLYSGAAPALQWLTPGLAIEGYGAYYLGDQLGDSNSDMRKSWRNVAKDPNLGTIDEAIGATAFPFLGASGTLLKTAGTVAPKVIGAAKTAYNVPQVRTAGTGIKEVWNKPYRWSELGKQRSVYRFEKPKTTSLRSNVKADPTRDVTKNRWYQDKSNPDWHLYSDPKVNPNARRFTGSEAAIKKYNLEAIQNRMAAGKKVSEAERVAVERSIGSMGDIKMRNYVSEVRRNFGEARAKQIEELVKNPNNYWDFKTFKEDPVNRFLLRSAPANKSEYLLPNKFAFDPVKKTSELKNMSPTDKFNYFKNIGGEYKVGVAQAESKMAPKIAEVVSPAGKISKTSKIGDKVAGFQDDDKYVSPTIETDKITTRIP